MQNFKKASDTQNFPNLTPPSSQTRGITRGSGGPKPEIDLTEAFWKSSTLLFISNDHAFKRNILISSRNVPKRKFCGLQLDVFHTFKTPLSLLMPLYSPVQGSNGRLERTDWLFDFTLHALPTILKDGVVEQPVGITTLATAKKHVVVVIFGKKVQCF